MNNSDKRFSVIIPLYNKEAEIERTIRSALAQSYAPLEIVVVDDGSTDRSAAIVEGIGSPLIRLIRQTNAGGTVTRNRAMSEALGDYFAFLDADDEWREGFLAEIAGMIDEFPECGLYCTGFDIIDAHGEHPAHTPKVRGVVDNFFREAMTSYVGITSSSVVPRTVVDAVGGFPEGMKIGGDQYMWAKIAREYPVCFSPARLMKYYKEASNRTTAIYRTVEVTPYSFAGLYDPANPWLNEYIARVALGKAIVLSVKGDSEAGRRAERFFAYNRGSRRAWWRLWVLNRLPARLRPPLHTLYTRLAWRIAKKGL
ncbi:MAG: glycosyltransferase family 2 protein [Rikenellaceae bacterium]|jgi:glycosyltransferase involved in cell wall biosynthesis|nr:glycosyltransferase family 2 protein [Rikenellaceae bacterium]